MSTDGVGPGDEDSPRDERVLRSLRRILRAVALFNRRVARIYQLTATQLVCLRHLSKVEAIPIGELAQAIALSQATVTTLIDRLEQRGLVERERSHSDRRRVFVRLTTEGRELAASAPLPLHEHFARRLERLSAAQQDEIDRVLQHVVEMMEAEDIDAAPLLESEPSLLTPADGGPTPPLGQSDGSKPPRRRDRERKPKQEPT